MNKLLVLNLKTFLFTTGRHSSPVQMTGRRVVRRGEASLLCLATTKNSRQRGTTSGLSYNSGLRKFFIISFLNIQANGEINAVSHLRCTLLNISQDFFLYNSFNS